MPRNGTRIPTIWRLIRRNNPRALRRFESGLGKGLVLVLTTTGRKSGLPRKTPLQYEEIGGVLYVGSARGTQADWYRNLLANPRVQVQIGKEAYAAVADPLRTRQEALDFLRERLRRRPLMIRSMFLLHGMAPWGGEGTLAQLADKVAVIALHDCRRVEETCREEELPS